MNAYLSLAEAYDRFTADVDYGKWLRWYARWFRRDKVQSVVDLGCGTGTLTCLLSGEGYRVTGVDLSEDMLSQAMDKVLELDEDNRPLLVCQPMEALRLPETVDAVVCSLDCLNYLTSRTDLKRTCKAVARALRPGGLFLFDIIPVWEFARRDGQVFVDEDEDALCLWRADWDRRRRVLTYGLDLFQRRGDGAWDRAQEDHQERGWTGPELDEALDLAGLEPIAATGEDLRTPPAESDTRLFYVCRKRKESKE